MGKQAMGIYVSNYQLRLDTMAHLLYYPQKPLVGTNSMTYLRFSELPAGQNAIVAIACYSGYNQEDSVILNQSAIDRGLFRSIYYRSYNDHEESSEEFSLPTNKTTEKMRPIEKYSKLDPMDGLVEPNIRLTGDDILIGKTSALQTIESSGMNVGLDSIKKQSVQTRKDSSTALKSTVNGFADQVVLTTDNEGNKFAKVRIRSIRIPQIGDKFASRHGQKGTCVTGDHLVLTSHGWKYISEIDHGTDVWSFNTNTFTGEWKSVTGTTSHTIDTTDNNDKLYRFSAQNIDVVTTGDHRMLLAKLNSKQLHMEYVTAADCITSFKYDVLKNARYTNKLFSNDRGIPTTAINQQPHSMIMIPGIELICEYWYQYDYQISFLQWLGFWLGNGSITPHGTPYQTSIKQYTSHGIEWLDQLYQQVWPGYYSKIRCHKGIDNDGIVQNGVEYRTHCCPPL